MENGAKGISRRNLIQTTALVAASVAFARRALGAPAEFKNPVFPYGAVYYRKSGPPAADWARDHKTAAQLGTNTFSHRFLWAVVETRPGNFDWSDYDQLMDIAAENKIKVVIREISNGTPEWMFNKYLDGRVVNVDDRVSHPGLEGSTATGEAPMCLDHDDIMAANERFQTALIERYRNHPANMGYDLWNELVAQECYCPSTQAKFREWLNAKYGTLEALGNAWNSYSWGDWSNVEAPRRPGNYPVDFDWLQFRKDNMFSKFNRRAALYRRLDPKHPVTTHSDSGGLFFGSATHEDWRAADAVDITGYTWVASRTGDAPWIQFQAVDYLRGTARGKPFWHGEAQAGPLWMQPQVNGRARDDGRISYPTDVRLWNLVSMALGTRGIFDTRWRPLVDGPLFGAFGGMNLDGSVTPQMEMEATVARWANAHPEIWKSNNVKGEIGIVFVPESMMFDQVQQHNTNNYSQSIRGVYRAFYDSNIQADFVHIDDISQYPVVYLPYPLMLKAATSQKLRDYVQKGGKLVSEGLPGYWDDSVAAGTIQPNLGLDKLFGARESYVEFTPDLNEKLTLTVQGKQIGGRFFIQEYKLAGGKSAGHYGNGHIAAVENIAGSGKTLLVGTFPGASYFMNQSATTREFFADLLAWGGILQQIKSSDAAVKARLSTGAGGTYLWVVNATKTLRNVTITLPSAFKQAEELWQESTTPVVEGETLTTAVGDRNVAVIRLG
jgi:beta-galactosidase